MKEPEARRLRVAWFFVLCLSCVWPASASGEEAARRGLFVTVLQDPPIFSSRESIQGLVDFAGHNHIDTLFVQIYRANQAWFPSRVGDAAPYEAAKKKLSEDPFALLIRRAHASGLEVHAWVNLLSLSANERAPLLKKYGKSILTRNRQWKWRLKDYRIDNQYFLEPGDPRVREELCTMVEEIVRVYPELDGLQLDYIRYPDRNPDYGYTKRNVARFKEATAGQAPRRESPAWQDWKRAQVTGLLQALVRRARDVRPDIQVSTTGLVPYSRALHEGFQDWRHWLQSGAVDFVTLMCYAPSTPEFQKYLKDARKKAENLGKVNIAVGAYRLGGAPGTFEEQLEL